MTLSTATTRFTNRSLLVFVGLVLIALGAAVVTLLVWPTARDWASTQIDALAPAIDDFFGATEIASSGISWIAVIAFALLMLLVWWAFTVIFGQGGTRAQKVHRSSEAPVRASEQAAHTTSPAVSPDAAPAGSLGGSITVRPRTAASVVDEALRHTSDVVRSRTDAVSVGYRPTLRTVVWAQPGASPAAIRDAAEHAIGDWRTLLGENTPALVEIRPGGGRTVRAPEQQSS